MTNRLKRWLSKERLLGDIPEQDNTDESASRRPSLPVILYKLQSPHVEVDCTDESGATPLILAALNGQSFHWLAWYTGWLSTLVGLAHWLAWYAG